ncbi:MAG: hypothetical protein H7337_02175 [Rhizobacter sp.]|nr:hypothetical protein [Rhizobacter sp.]
MNNESDWVADVRRWCLAGAQAKTAASAPSTESKSSSTSDLEDVGYEAAHPALQSRHWPDAPNGAATDLH